jgi:cation diffusion facilitator family transporter
MSGHGGGDPVKVIKAALYANLAIAAVKLIAAYLSHSTATLAEAVHSLADTSNQALLLIGVRLASKREDDRFPFGRASERYFWPFVVALLLFSVGGMFALYEGIHKMVNPEPPDLSAFWSFRHGPLTSLLVLGVSMVLEGYSCSVALKEFRQSSQGPLGKAIFASKDPTIPLVLMEDIAALVGLTLAFVTVGLCALTNDGRWDAAGSILIGILLMVVAVLIARDTHSLLIGERATPEMEAAALEEAKSVEGVIAITQLLTMHLGPDFVVLAVKVALDPEMKIAKAEEVIDEMERRIRSRVPEMKKVFIEPDSKGDQRGLPTPERAS